MLKNQGRPGALLLDNSHCRFRVWAPKVSKMEVVIKTPFERSYALERADDGYFFGILDGIKAGASYFLRLDGQTLRPDPASLCQLESVHGPSVIVDQKFHWTDSNWKNHRLRDYVIYEMHIGTFTREGTFEAAISKLDELVAIGITAIELMPVAQFPGTRNWGYDGVLPYAAQNSYGGLAGLKKLVNACHEKGLSVVLDVVYNHMGPEGNYLNDFGDYFTEKYKTPWGLAINFDGEYSREVREYFIQNALFWINECHIDGLRLDAVHAIYDRSALSFFEELSQRVDDATQETGKNVYLIAESDLNDPRFVKELNVGGYGFHAQWNDDFHHALHAAITGEVDGYYQDFAALSKLQKAYERAYSFNGEYSVFRKRKHGRAATGVPDERFVVYSQNHDQIGNRMLGERLSALVGFESQKLAAVAVLVSPFVPMLFMGEEYGETAPFLYFTSHSDENLIEAVRKGRKAEFAAFNWQSEPPDPQSVETFEKSKLQHELKEKPRNRSLQDFYKFLLGLVKELRDLGLLRRDGLRCTLFEAQKSIALHYELEDSGVLLILNFSEKNEDIAFVTPQGKWQRVFDSSDSIWQGPGANSPRKLNSAAYQNVSVRTRAAVCYVNFKDLIVEV